MNRELFYRHARALVLAAAALALSPAPAGAATRPISDFLSTQGTYCIDDGAGGCFIFVPPVANFVGWTVTGGSQVATVDYAGLANGSFDCDGIGFPGGTTSFGTTMDGTIVERPLRDGRAEVTVVLHSRNALAWVADGGVDGNFAGPLLFGNRVCDVIAGAEPALVDSQLQVVFTIPARGAALPDLIKLFFAPDLGQELISLAFRAQGSGELRSAFGVADGTAGRLTIAQTGTLSRTRFGGATGDGFPAELINLRVVGR